MALNGKHHGLRVQMLHRSHPVTAGSETQTRVLDPLEVGNGRRLDVWNPCRSGEVKERADGEFERDKQRFLVLPPRRPGQSLEHLEPRGRLLPHCLQMGGEGEEGVQDDAQDLRMLIKEQLRTVEEDARMIVELVRKGTEESNLGLCNGDVEF